MRSWRRVYGGGDISSRFLTVRRWLVAVMEMAMGHEDLILGGSVYPSS